MHVLLFILLFAVSPITQIIQPLKVDFDNARLQDSVQIEYRHSKKAISTYNIKEKTKLTLLYDQSNFVIKKTLFRFDDRGYLFEEIARSDSDSVMWEIFYNVDTQGKVTKRSDVFYPFYGGIGANSEYGDLAIPGGPPYQTTSEYKYDTVGNLKKVETCDNGIVQTVELYDARGNKIEIDDSLIPHPPIYTVLSGNLTFKKTIFKYDKQDKIVEKCEYVKEKTHSSEHPTGTQIVFRTFYSGSKNRLTVTTYKTYVEDDGTEITLCDFDTIAN